MNIPDMKPGVIAVSRDCVPTGLSEPRRAEPRGLLFV